MNACYTYIHWTSAKHVSVERNLGIVRDVVAICDMANGIEICMTAEMARDLSQQMIDVAGEIEREEKAKQKPTADTAGR